MQIKPPKYMLRFLRWYCREDFLEEIEGDLLELFERDCKRHPGLARWNFSWQVLNMNSLST